MKTVPGWLTALLWIFATTAVLLYLLAFLAPMSTLFPAGAPFVDIAVYKGRFTLYHSAKFFTSRAYSAFAYPAGAAPIYAALYSTTNALTTYLLTTAAIVLAALVAAIAFLKRRGATALLLPLAIICSFPIVFLIQRANIEVILALLVALGLIAYRRGLAIIAAILFGVAAAIKLYPILLLGLFLSRRKDLPAFAVGVVTAIVAMTAAISYTGPTFATAAQGFFTGVNRFQVHYVDVVSKVEIAFDHCLFSPLKLYAFTHHTSPAPWKPYYFAGAGLLTLLLFLRVRTLPFLNRVLFLTVAMVALPPVSFTYTLISLDVPLIFLIGAFLNFRTRPPATAVFALALLLFLMLPIMAVSSLSPGLPTGPMQAAALLLLLIAASLAPWPESGVREAA